MNVILRKLLRRQIETAQTSCEPLGVLRDPSNNRLIEFDVVNEPGGLFSKPQPHKVA
ncbi:MAG TPA: hypothetical protein VJ646_08375 [Candidatus Binatia bacterium]|nr:hypothetical protein [Candidatus Binatia bacterium]